HGNQILYSNGNAVQLAAVEASTQLAFRPLSILKRLLTHHRNIRLNLSISLVDAFKRLKHQFSRGNKTGMYFFSSFAYRSVRHICSPFSVVFSIRGYLTKEYYLETTKHFTDPPYCIRFDLLFPGVCGKKDMLPLALPSNSPLWAIIHLLIRPVQPIQRIMEVFIRPGAHHQNPLNFITPGWGIMPGSRKWRTEVWIILICWITQCHNQENCKYKKHHQEHRNQEDKEAHRHSLPFLAALVRPQLYSPGRPGHPSPALQIPCIAPGKWIMSIFINASIKEK